MFDDIVEVKCALRELSFHMRRPKPWIEGLCVAGFHAEKGQILEHISSELVLSAEERRTLPYLALPDTNSQGLGDSTHCFRMRRDMETPLLSKVGGGAGAGAPPAAALAARASSSHSSRRSAAAANAARRWVYGYVFFRQSRDASLARGSFQKSCVLLSVHPFNQFFTRLIRIVGTLFFEHGDVLLESICETIKNCWPRPTAGARFNLPLMGTVLNVRLPWSSHALESPLATTTSSSSAHSGGLISSSDAGGEAPSASSSSASDEGGEQQRAAPFAGKTALAVAAVAAGARARAGAGAMAPAPPPLPPVVSPAVKAAQQLLASGDIVQSEFDAIVAADTKVRAAQTPRSSASSSSSAQKRRLTTPSSTGVRSVAESSAARRSDAGADAAGAADALGSAAGSAMNSSRGRVVDASPEKDLSLNETFRSRDLQARGLFTDVPLFAVLPSELMSCLWHVWQVVLLGEPLIILGATPNEVSSACLAVVSLISPLVYSSDFRPYFTLYDHDFKEVEAAHKLASAALRFRSGSSGGGGGLSAGSPRGGTPRGTPAPSSPRGGRGSSSGRKSGSSTPSGRTHRPRVPGMILGVTNPMILKVLSHWPNVLYVGGGGNSSVKGMPGMSAGRGHSPRAAKILTGRLRRESQTASLTDDGVLGDAELAAGPQMLTRSASLLSPDPDVLRQLLRVPAESSHGRSRSSSGSGSGGGGAAQQLTLRFGGECAFADADEGGVTPAIAINSAVLRQHFHRLTLQLLSVFERYFSMRPVATGAQAAAGHACGGAIVHPYSDPKDCFERFNENDFLKSIRAASVPVSFRQCGVTSTQQWSRLCKRFLHSPNFKPWFMGRRKEGLRAFDALKRALRLSMTGEDFVAQIGAAQNEHGFEVCLRIQKAMRPELARIRFTPPRPDGSHEDVEAAELLECERLVVSMRDHLVALWTTLPPEIQQSIDLHPTALPPWLEAQQRSR